MFRRQLPSGLAVFVGADGSGHPKHLGEAGWQRMMQDEEPSQAIMRCSSIDQGGQKEDLLLDL